MIKRVLVFLLALCTIAALASCTKPPAIEPTEPVVNPEDYTTAAPETDPPVLPGMDDVTEPPEEPTTIEPASEDPATEEPTSVVDPSATTVTTTAAAADPTKMGKEELVKYYNDAVNAVRAAKPAYTKVEVLKINDFKTSIAGGIADGLIKPLVKNMMPGDPETTSRKKGEDNVDHFFIEQATSAVKAGDLSSITAKKEGANYVITLTLGKENNPERKGASKYSRVFQIQTRQDVLDELAGGGLTGDAKDCIMTYRDGKAVVTINEKGQIIKASTGFYVDVDAKNMKISFLNPDIVAYQQSNWEYTNFVY